MPVKLEDRPVEAVREEVIDQLIMNYGHGEISLEAFERRLDMAMASEDNVLLKSLVEDLTLQVDDNYRDTKTKEQRQSSFGDHQSCDELVVTVLGDKECAGVWTVGDELKVYNVLGHTRLDFSMARFTNPTLRLKVYNVLGDVKILVPEQINVVSRAFNILGSVKNRASNYPDPAAPTIYVEGFSILADIKISVKQAMREKWLGFAESLKRMFS